MRLVLISDTHNQQRSLRLPAGDVLVHAGDFTMRGTEPEVRAFGEWLADQPYEHKVLIAGNHDFLFEREPQLARSLLPAHVHYLFDSEVTLGGLRFWGAPWQPWFLDWAFNLRRGPELAARWALIPEGYGLYGDKANVAICDEKYRLVNRPIVVELSAGGGPPVFVEGPGEG